jgi:hypothetical protein
MFLGRFSKKRRQNHQLLAHFVQSYLALRGKLIIFLTNPKWIWPDWREIAHEVDNDDGKMDENLYRRYSVGDCAFPY